MDWSKAKNILIIAFIITNIFLVFSIKHNLDEKDFFYQVDEERINDVVEILENRDIILKTDIPTESLSLPVLTLEYEAYDPEEIAELFLGEYRVKDNEYVKRNESLMLLYNNKQIVYEKNPEWFNTNDIGEERARELADSFIEKHGFMNKNVNLWDISKDDEENYNVVYSQQHEELVLEDSHMKVVVDNVGVIYFERRWLEPQNEKTYKKTVIPSTTALLMAIDDIKTRVSDNYDKAVITEIRLGYLLDISKFDSLIKWYDMESGDASPYWRITVEDNEHKLEDKYIFIEAYE